MSEWKWISIVAIVAGQASYAAWAAWTGAPWRAVVIGVGFAILNAAIFTQPTNG